jgi:hypothetical protein
MAFTLAKHGINAAVFISGTQLDGANAWSLTIDQQSAEYVKFGDSWVNRVTGARDWSGNVSAVHDQDAKQLQDACTAGETVGIVIYPDGSDDTTYYSGEAIFSFGSEAGTDAAITQSSDFVGDGALDIEGFS